MNLPSLAKTIVASISVSTLKELINERDQLREQNTMLQIRMTEMVEERRCGYAKAYDDCITGVLRSRHIDEAVNAIENLKRNL
jgi:hypothetical protein